MTGKGLHKPGQLLLIMTSGLVLSVCLAVGLRPFSHAGTDDPRARAIMERVDVRDDGDNATMDLEMILIDKRGKERVRRILSFWKDQGEDTYRIMFFTHPANVKDTGFLTYDYDDPDRDDDQWLYLPALKKTKRIANDDKDGSFMGSDFSYADMTDKNLEDYDYSLLKEAEVNGVETWVIQAVPRTKKVIDTYGYTKSVAFVRKDNDVVIRAVHWVKKGNRLKYMDVKRLDRINNIWIPTEVTMTTKEGRITVHKTILKRENVKFNQDLEESRFTVRELEKGP